MKSLLLSALLLPGLAIAQQSRKAAMQQRIDKLGIRETPALRDYTLSEFMDYMNSVFRRNGITGTNLVRMLSDLYHDHGMSEHDFQLRHRVERDSEDLPRIICSEAFV